MTESDAQTGFAFTDFEAVNPAAQFWLIDAKPTTSIAYTVLSPSLEWDRLDNDGVRPRGPDQIYEQVDIAARRLRIGAGAVSGLDEGSTDFAWQSWKSDVQADP